MINQTEIRNKIKLIRNNLSAKEVENNSNEIFKKLINLENFTLYESYFVYLDFKNEVKTDKIIDYLKSLNKTVCHPLIKGDKMLCVKPTSNDFILDSFKIKTPTTYQELSKVDVAVIPLIACDENKNRVGFGKGYYDRFLKDKNILKIGLCHDFQVVKSLNPNSWDIPLNIIITEKRIIK